MSIVVGGGRDQRVTLFVQAQGFLDEAVAHAEVLGELVALAAPVFYGLAKCAERDQAIDCPGVGAVLVLGADLKGRIAGVKALGQAVAELVCHTLKACVLGGVTLRGDPDDLLSAWQAHCLRSLRLYLFEEM